MVKIGHSQWKCAACGVFYNVNSNLRAHIESKHYSPGYKCPYCGLMLKTRNGIKHHIDNKHGIICSHCGIQFANRKLYNMHFATHQCSKVGNIWIKGLIIARCVHPAWYNLFLKIIYQKFVNVWRWYNENLFSCKKYDLHKMERRKTWDVS